MDYLCHDKKKITHWAELPEFPIEDHCEDTLEIIGRSISEEFDKILK